MVVGVQFSEAISGHVASSGSDAQVTGLVLTGLDRQSNGRPKHFYLRDLTNPQQAYWAHIGEEPPPSAQLQDIFARGKRLHWEAGYVFRGLRAYAEAEGVLDGGFIDLPVRGKADFRLGTNLVEFKTTAQDIQTAAEVWEERPHDIEQLLFYTALWTYEEDEHFLVYFVHGEENPLRVFRVEVENHGHIEHVLRQRVDLLDRALEEGAPALAKRCRYFEAICSIYEAGLCDCDGLDGLGTSGLEDAVTLTRDPILEDEWWALWQERTETHLKPVLGWDLEVPRQAYLRLSELQDSDYDQPSTEALWRAIRDTDLAVEESNVPGVEPFQTEREVAVGFTWIKVKKTRDGEVKEEVVPAILRRWGRDWEPTENNRRNWSVSLAAVCAKLGQRTGYVILHAPEMDAGAFAYRFDFRNLGELQESVRERVRNLEQAILDDDPDFLPECPQWMIERNDCEGCLCRD